MNSATSAMLPLKKFSTKVLLVDDQEIIAEAIRHMLDDQKDISFYYCSDPGRAVQFASEIRPTVILQDLAMPGIDGLKLIDYYRSTPTTKEIPVIALSTEEEPKIKAHAFSLGASDYMVKLPEKIELIARIRYHSAAYIRLLERNEAYQKLEESQKKLNQELQEAAAYVTSLLPNPLAWEVESPLSVQWRFIPSTKLGGDALGYHFLDPNHFCFYLLDVCGHGVGAAVLSISIMNVLRARTLPETNFYNPDEVLSVLNAKFPMEEHHEMFFTIWYGVYNIAEREIVYSSGGHPPAVLITRPSSDKVKAIPLSTPGLVIGGMAEAQYTKASLKIEKNSRLFLFSDGVYEIGRQDGETFSLHEFIQFLKEPAGAGENDLDRIVRVAKELNGPGPFADDFSILEIKFNA